MKKKFAQWAARYAPMEIAATCTMLLIAGTAYLFTDNKAIIAYVATIGDNVGYYGFGLTRETLRQRKIRGGEPGSIRSDIFPAIRNIFLEFGAAESLDAFVARPLLIYIAQQIISDFTVALIAGKLCSDIVFYIPTIIARELMKRYAR